METTMDRFQTIFTDEQMYRIERNNETLYTVDLHGLHKDEAERFLNNIINILRHPALIDVIHGYNNGTVLREMLRNDFENEKVREIAGFPNNPGMTHVNVA